MRYHFHELPIGKTFTMPCGTPYRKKSSRTAWTEPGHPAHAEGRWFWFGQNEVVHIVD